MSIINLDEQMKDLTTDIIPICDNVYINIVSHQMQPSCQHFLNYFSGQQETLIKQMKEQKVARLRSQNIKTIISCSNQNMYLKEHGISYFCINKNDPLIQHFAKVNKFIDVMKPITIIYIQQQETSQNKNVLIECFLQPSRSPMYAIAYLMSHGIPSGQAQEIVMNIQKFDCRVYQTDIKMYEDDLHFMKNTFQTQTTQPTIGLSQVEEINEEKYQNGKRKFQNPLPSMIQGLSIQNINMENSFCCPSIVNSEILQQSQISFGMDIETMSQHSQILGKDVQCLSEAGSQIYGSDLNINWNDFQAPQPNYPEKILMSTSQRSFRTSDENLSNSLLSIFSERNSMIINDERYSKQRPLPIMQSRGGSKLEENDKKQLRGPKTFTTSIQPKK